jgi:hypothetical protein
MSGKNVDAAGAEKPSKPAAPVVLIPPVEPLPVQEDRV